MDIKMKTVIYETGKSLGESVDLANLNNIGFDCNVVAGDSHRLFENLSRNKVDILVCYDNDIDASRLEFVLDIVYNNYCKHILVIGNKRLANNTYNHIDLSDRSNFDLKLNSELLKLKRKIETNPSRNTTMLRSKICELLCSFMFSSRHDGFRYYVDAILLSYLSFPYPVATMIIYKEIATTYKKSVGAVEKSMRSALYSAFSKLKDAPLTPEIMKKRTYLTYDMNNNTAISMMVSQLMLDKEINAGLDLVGQSFLNN